MLKFLFPLLITARPTPSRIQLSFDLLNDKSELIPTKPCPCQDVSLCNVVSSWPDKEVFGFGADRGSWQEFPMDLITTIAWPPLGISEKQLRNRLPSGELNFLHVGSNKTSNISKFDSEILLCVAHKYGVRLIAGAPNPWEFMVDDPLKRSTYVKQTVALVQKYHLDGVTFDYESPDGWDYNDGRAKKFYSTLVQETRAALKSQNAGYQISVCVPWSPGGPRGIDGRAYDFEALAAVSDFLYVMQYDTRSQIIGGECVAAANCAFPVTDYGMRDWLSFVTPDKLVMGVPWYGYSYPCVTDKNEEPIVVSSKDDAAAHITTCTIPLKPFRGVNCSDAAGFEIAYDTIREILNGGDASGSVVTTPIRRDARFVRAPNFNYFYTKSGSPNALRQLWFDDAISLREKYIFAKEMSLRGVGPYRFDQATGRNGKVMFDALREFVVESKDGAGQEILS